MDCEEEQKMEIEALEAILMHDLQRVDGGFEVQILPDPEGTNHISASLFFAHPADYPNVVPTLRIVHKQGGMLDEEWARLDALLAKEAEQNLGMPMVFTLVEAMREWMVQHNHPPVSIHDEMMMRRKKKEQEQQKKEAEAEAAATKGDAHAGAKADGAVGHAGGTIVTRETFLEWKAAFEAEMAIGKVVVADDPDRPTGREFFERMIREGKSLNEDGEDGEFLSDDEADDDHVQQVEIDEALFGGDDLDDELLAEVE